jgi:dephospho-CoA kinase
MAVKNKKIKVAITGNIGSGKSTFSSFLTELGYPVINADEISKTILVSDPIVRKKVISEFGEKSYDGDKINSLFMAEKVFSDKKKLQILNSILHPLVMENIDQKIPELHKKNDIVFCETALLFEAKLKKMFDYVILIIADYELRKERIIESKRITKIQFSKRSENQIPDEKKIDQADFTFYNNGSKEELSKKITLLLLSLNSIISKQDN